MKSIKIAAVGAALALTLAACAGDGAGEEDTTAPEATEGETADEGDGAIDPSELLIGVAMPTETTERWIQDGNALKDGLEALGYQVDLQYARDDIPVQSQQVEQMITKGADLLIIGAIDGTALAGQLEQAAANDIPVISYDRLIRDSENVDFYTTFDNFNVGIQQGTALLAGLKILNEDGSPGEATGPFNIELFAGSLDDNNAKFFFDGAMSILQPKIDDGTLVVKSGQTDIEQVATQGWLQETAQKRMEDLLTSTYNDGTKIEGVLAANDSLARGIITALQNAGYGPTLADGLPPTSGQDAEIASTKLIVDGVQFSSIFKDTRKLAAQAIEASEDFLNGREPEANDTETYDNGVKVVPSYLLDVDIVFAGNVQELLIDSGYWTPEEVAAGVSE